MRKGLASGSLLALTLFAVYLAGGLPTAVPSETSRVAALGASVSASEPEVERAALTSRDRVHPAIGELGKWDAVPVVAGEANALLEQLVMAERAVRDPAVTGKELAY